MMGPHKNAQFTSMLVLILFVTVFNFAYAADEEMPSAKICWAYSNVAKLGGNNEKKEEKNCDTNQYCYVATKANSGNGSHLSATQAQFLGGCVAADNPILKHPGIDKPDKEPSCSKQPSDKFNLVCVCNSNLCNIKVKTLHLI